MDDFWAELEDEWPDVFDGLPRRADGAPDMRYAVCQDVLFHLQMRSLLRLLHEDMSEGRTLH